MCTGYPVGLTVGLMRVKAVGRGWSGFGPSTPARRARSGVAGAVAGDPVGGALARDVAPATRTVAAMARAHAPSATRAATPPFARLAGRSATSGADSSSSIWRVACAIVSGQSHVAQAPHQCKCDAGKNHSLNRVIH